MGSTYVTIVSLYHFFCLYLAEPLDALLFNLMAANIFFKSNSHWSTVQLLYTIRVIALLLSWRWVNQWPQIHDQSMANKHQINAKHTNNHRLNGKFSVLKCRIWRSTLCCIQVLNHQKPIWFGLFNLNLNPTPNPLA